MSNIVKCITFGTKFLIAPMATIIQMPLLSDTMTEGKIAQWNKKVGDKVKSDDALADVETDKATMDVIGYTEGTLLYIGVEAGQSAKVNDIIAIIGEPGEDISSYINNNNKQSDISIDFDIAHKEVANTSPENEVNIPSDVTIIRMPLLSDTMTEGKIVVWNKKIGDIVKSDDAIAEVETDKATMEVVPYAEGTLLYRGVEAGQSAKINEIIAIIGSDKTDIQSFLPALLAQKNIAEKPVQSTTEATHKQENVTLSKEENNNTSRVKASPLAKSIAKQKGIDLSQISGTGDGGRIIRKDVENAHLPLSKANVTNEQSKTISMQDAYTDTPVSQMRKIIAQRLSESKFSAPHFYLKISVELDKLLDIRKQLNAVSEVKISVNDMIIKASALALQKHPEVNSSWMGDFVRTYSHIHIGSAIALSDGLIVPVIRNANLKSLKEIATDAASLYEKARNKKIQPQEFTGNTFTISNLGMMDIDEFTAIINPPDACILAVGKGTPTPVVQEGKVVIKNILKLTLSCDHRVVDGAVGAAFLQTLKSYIENPIGMII